MFRPRVTLVPVLTVTIGLKMDALAINLVQYSSPASLKLRHRRRTSNESNRTRRVEKLHNRLNNPLQFHNVDPGSTTDGEERPCVADIFVICPRSA